MGDPEVIDLTNSFTLAELPPALVRAVIEVNDDLYNSPPPRTSRRTRSTRRQTNDAQCTIDIVNTPVENITPTVRRRKPRKSKNNPEATQTLHTDKEVVRDRSPLDNGIGTCAICLEKFKSQPLCSTKCGHVFCETCLQASLRNDKKCPTCRKSLRGKTAVHPVYL